jgi:hypothetical protein
VPVQKTDDDTEDDAFTDEELASEFGMDAEFVKSVFEAIHEESVRQQMEVINK